MESLKRLDGTLNQKSPRLLSLVTFGAAALGLRKGLVVNHRNPP
jgi:hypothetical protein